MSTWGWGGFVTDRDGGLRVAGRPANRDAPIALAALLRGSPRVLAGQSAGVRWAIHAGVDQAGRLGISVTRTCNGTTTTSDAGGSPLRAGQLISMWIGRGPVGMPPFLVLRAAPEVQDATVILASGGRREMALSPVIKDLGFRLGASPLPEEDQLASVEIGSRHQGRQVIDLWRPPVRLW
jgi:hypothetical protein